MFFFIFFFNGGEILLPDQSKGESLILHEKEFSATFVNLDKPINMHFFMHQSLFIKKIVPPIYPHNSQARGGIVNKERNVKHMTYSLTLEPLLHTA